MYQFAATAPLTTIAYAEPVPDDRSGVPLTQGLIIILIATTAAEHCTPAMLSITQHIDPDGWYDGQLLETILSHFEQTDSRLVMDVGKHIYYTLEAQFRAMGLQTPTDVVTAMPGMWQLVTRGDSGEWRNTITGPKSARIELQQPYNCRFEQGALQGALECLDAQDVTIRHDQCMRDGASCCILDVQWQ